MHSSKIMTATEKLHQLIQSLPPGTLAGFRGIAKRPRTAPSDRELQAEYTDYLTQKYL
jgi:hypothetical protein